MESLSGELALVNSGDTRRGVYLPGNLFESVDREWGYQNKVTMLYNGG